MVKKFPLIERPTPVFDVLKRRPTIILDEPIVKKINPFSPQLPPGVTREEAIETVRELWGKKLAAGIADRAGLTGRAREEFIEKWRRVVAEGVVGGV